LWVNRDGNLGDVEESDSCWGVGRVSVAVPFGFGWSGRDRDCDTTRPTGERWPPRRRSRVQMNWADFGVRVGQSRKTKEPGGSPGACRPRESDWSIIVINPS